MSDNLQGLTCHIDVGINQHEAKELRLMKPKEYKRVRMFLRAHLILMLDRKRSGKPLSTFKGVADATS